MHDEGPAHRTGPDAESNPLLAKGTGSTPTVRAHDLRDAQGECLDVMLGHHVDEQVGANVYLPPFRCLHLNADADATYTIEGLNKLAHRSGHRSIVTTDGLPPAMRDAYEIELLAVLDWAFGGTAA